MFPQWKIRTTSGCRCHVLLDLFAAVCVCVCVLEGWGVGAELLRSECESSGSDQSHL